MKAETMSLVILLVIVNLILLIQC